MCLLYVFIIRLYFLRNLLRGWYPDRHPPTPVGTDSQLWPFFKGFPKRIVLNFWNFSTCKNIYLLFCCCFCLFFVIFKKNWGDGAWGRSWPGDGGAFEGGSRKALGGPGECPSKNWSVLYCYYILKSCYTPTWFYLV